LTEFREDYGTLLKWIKKNRPYELKWLRLRLSPEVWLSNINSIKTQNLNFFEHSFVFSTSSNINDRPATENLYMWGHYGNGHRGVAIEFDTEKLIDSVTKKHFAIEGKMPGVRDVMFKILYEDTLEKLSNEDFLEFLKSETPTLNDTRLSIYLNKVSRLKSSVWSAENEWRMMWTDENAGREIFKIDIAPEAVTRIVIGWKTDDKIADLIISECRASFPEAELIRASPRQGEFALNFTACR